MNTVFIGGSRHISRLPSAIKTRLTNVIENGHHVIVGDANGADKAVQKFLSEAFYKKVTVFCSGDDFRNNLGHWETRKIAASPALKGFQFFAEKDREMAREADFGLMIWDGKSPGTMLNVLRLLRAGKKTVLYNVPDKKTHYIKSEVDWDAVLSSIDPVVIDALRQRATPDEWPKVATLVLPDLPAELPLEHPVQHRASSVPISEAAKTAARAIADEESDLADDLNAALAIGDPAVVIEVLGAIARSHGMAKVAQDTGLARESLYRALRRDGNPEFATVLKVLSVLHIRLLASRTHAEAAE